jgi:hypothetical protein
MSRVALCIAHASLHSHTVCCTTSALSSPWCASRARPTRGPVCASLVHHSLSLAHCLRNADFVKSHFAHNSLIASGSECGSVYLSDMESGEVIQTLEHGPGVVYSARWCAAQVRSSYLPSLC